MTFDASLEREWQRMLRAVPLPVNPHQPMVLNLPCNGAQEIHPERDDFARDAEASGL